MYRCISLNGDLNGESMRNSFKSDMVFNYRMIEILTRWLKNLPYAKYKMILITLCKSLSL